MKLNNKQQAEAMLYMLINNGREAQNEDRFTLSHDDVMMLLELIKERIMAIE